MTFHAHTAQQECEVLFKPPRLPIIQPSVWARKWVARSPETMLHWPIMSMAYLCWPALPEKYSSCNILISTALGKPSNSRSMIKERFKKWLNLKQPQKTVFGLNHQAHEGWGWFSVVPSLQRSSIFCIDLISHWFLIYHCSLLSPRNIYVCPQLFLQHSKLRAKRNLTQTRTWWVLV